MIINHPSLDVYQNPKKKKDEIFISYPDYDKYVFREFTDRERIMKDRGVAGTPCLCATNLPDARSAGS